MTVWLTWLDEVAQAAVTGSGIPAAKVVEIDGWTTRGHGSFPVPGPSIVVGHHTGTATSAKGDYPTQNVVVNGRSDLPGPLCNVGLGRNGSVYVVAAGVAWHAGASAFAGLTDLNSKSVGIEAEASGSGTDWTPAQLVMYPRLVAELLRRLGQGADRYVSHRTCATPAGRKSDPTGIADDWMRIRVAALLAAPSTIPPTPPKPRDGDTVMPLNIPLAAGEHADRFGFPTGTASAVVARTWLSFISLGPAGGSGHVFFQTQTGGLKDQAFTVAFDAKNGRSGVTTIEVPSGTWQVNVQWTFANAGKMVVEVEPK